MENPPEALLSSLTSAWDPWWFLFLEWTLPGKRPLTKHQIKYFWMLAFHSNPERWGIRLTVWMNPHVQTQQKDVWFLPMDVGDQSCPRKPFSGCLPAAHPSSHFSFPLPPPHPGCVERVKHGQRWNKLFFKPLMPKGAGSSEGRGSSFVAAGTLKDLEVWNKHKIRFSLKVPLAYPLRKLFFFFRKELVMRPDWWNFCSNIFRSRWT